MNSRRETFIPLQRHTEVPAHIVTAPVFLAVIVAIACSLPQRSVPVVKAYSNESKKSGAALFHEKGCEHCHGANGSGGKRGPDLSTVGKRLKKQQIEHQIHDGGASMPAFGGVLQPDEIKDLVDFLRAKRKAPKNAVIATQSPSF